MNINYATIDKQYQECEGPFFLYDLDGLESHLAKLRQSLPNEISLWYACKANPLSDILHSHLKADWKLDIASLGELDQGIKAGHDPKNILSTGPAKSKKYFKSLLTSGLRTFVLESRNQAKWLYETASEMNLLNELTNLIRVQLDWSEIKGVPPVSVLGGNDITPFGLDLDEWEKDKELLQKLNVTGVHVFQWGNILDMEILKPVWNEIVLIAHQIQHRFNLKIKIVDLGGGLGLNYDKNKKALDVKDVSAALINLQNCHPSLNIWLELGRYSVGTFGKYFSKIIDVKTVRGKKIIVLEGGINHIARPALTNEAFPIIHHSNIESSSVDQEHNYTLHGPLCTALDNLGTHPLKSVPQVDDYIEFDLVGAYGFTESMPYFLCHDLASEVVICDGNTKIARRKESAKQWNK